MADQLAARVDGNRERVPNGGACSTSVKKLEMTLPPGGRAY